MQIPPSHPFPNNQSDTAGEDGDVSESEATEYASDEQASEAQSLASDFLHEERDAEDLNEPTTVVGFQKEPSPHSDAKAGETESVPKTSSPHNSVTNSSESTWGPEKELAYVNNTRGNKGKKNQGSSAVRRSKHHR